MKASQLNTGSTATLTSELIKCNGEVTEEMVLKHGVRSIDSAILDLKGKHGWEGVAKVARRELTPFAQMEKYRNT